MTVTLSPLQIDCDFDSGNIQYWTPATRAACAWPSAPIPTVAISSGSTSRPAA